MEKSILRQAASEIITSERNPYIVELGSGDCSKISILLDAIDERDFESIHYFPVEGNRMICFFGSTLGNFTRKQLNRPIMTGKELQPLLIKTSSM